MPYATLNGIRIHYEAPGEGDALLLISGLSGPAANWLFQVITFDDRGVGESDVPEAPSYPTRRRGSRSSRPAMDSRSSAGRTSTAPCWPSCAA